MFRFRIHAIALCAAGLAATAVATQAQPQPQPPLPAPGPRADVPLGGRLPGERSPEQTIRGTVRSFLLTPVGDVNGLLLDDGTQVELPPHLSASLTQGVRLHDRVTVTGVRAGGSPLMRAVEVKDDSTSAIVRVDGPPAATPPAKAAEAPALAQMTVDGRVAALLYSPRGDVGGVVMQDGTQVRFPPASGVARDLAVGRSMYARGFGTQGEHGRAMEATALGASASSAQPVFQPPAPLPDAAGGPPRPGAPGHADARQEVPRPARLPMPAPGVDAPRPRVDMPLPPTPDARSALPSPQAGAPLAPTPPDAPKAGDSSALPASR